VSAVNAMGKFLKVGKSKQSHECKPKKQKSKRWKKGHSCATNPETTKFRKAAKERLFSVNTGNHCIFSVSVLFARHAVSVVPNAVLTSTVRSYKKSESGAILRKKVSFILTSTPVRKKLDRCYDHEFVMASPINWSRLRAYWLAWSLTSFGYTRLWSRRLWLLLTVAKWHQWLITLNLTLNP